MGEDSPLNSMEEDEEEIDDDMDIGEEESKVNDFSSQYTI